MTIDVNAVQNNIYSKICTDFAEYADSKFQRYKSVLDFLRVTDVHEIVTPTTLEVYEEYCKFCSEKGYESLAHTVFSRTVCECGFATKHKQQYTPVKKKLIYFVMV